MIIFSSIIISSIYAEPKAESALPSPLPSFDKGRIAFPKNVTPLNVVNPDSLTKSTFLLISRSFIISTLPEAASSFRSPVLAYIKLSSSLALSTPKAILMLPMCA